MGWRKSSLIVLWTVAQLWDWGAGAGCVCEPECQVRNGAEVVEALVSENCPEVCVVEELIDLEKGLLEAKPFTLRENKIVRGKCDAGGYPTVVVGKQWRASEVGFLETMADLVKVDSNKSKHGAGLQFSGLRLSGIKVDELVYSGPRDMSYTIEDSIIFVHSKPDLEPAFDAFILGIGIEVPKKDYTDLCKGFCEPGDRIYLFKEIPSGVPTLWSMDKNVKVQVNNTYLVVGYSTQEPGSNPKVKLIFILSGVLVAGLVAVYVVMHAVKKRSKGEVFAIEGVGQVRVTSERLGQGAYGDVRSGNLRLRRNSQISPVEIPVAVKEVGCNQVCTSDGVARRVMAQRDIELSVSFEHENIVQCHGIVDLSSDLVIRYLIVMERLPGDLHKFIYGNQILGSPCTYRDLLNIFVDIVSGLQYLHDEMQCIHFDLKPSNILLTPGNCCKLADFGMSKICGDGSVEVTQLKGTRWYTAPETWILGQFENLQAQRVNTSVDIYSLGIVMWECVMRQKPGSIVSPSGGGPVPTIEMHSESSCFCIQCDCVPSLRDLISRCVNFHFDLFIEKLRAGDHTSETFGRPCLEEIQECLHSMLAEEWVNEVPPRWS